MSVAVSIGTVFGGSALVACGVVYGLRRPLHAVLWDLCVFEHRARFWMRACLVELVAGIGFAATVAAATVSDADGLTTASRILQGELAGAILGLLVIVLVVALHVRLNPR